MKVLIAGSNELVGSVVSRHLMECGREIICWSETNLQLGEMLLKSNQVDKPSLHGVLDKIRDLILPLISLICTPVKF
jgi:hypothetical protein